MKLHSMLGLVMLASSTTALAQTGTTFTYQGQLSTAAGPVDETADLRFRLYDNASSGNQIGGQVAINALDINEGLFSVELDFGASALAGGGGGTWLEIDVRSPAGAGAFTTLSPRNVITAAPFSVQTRGIFVADNGKIGIGTTSPGSAIANSVLDVFGGHIALQNNFGVVSVAADGIGIGAGFDTTNDDELSLFANGDERLRIADNGFVGISTSNPQTHLHVAGVIRAEGAFQFPDGSLMLSAPSPREINLAPFQISDGSSLTFEAPIPGAQPGDCVIINPPVEMRENDYIAWAYVSGPGMVRMRLCNPAGGGNTSYSANPWIFTVIK